MPQEVEAFSDFPVPVCIRAPNVVAEREFVSLGTPTISHDHASAEITIPWRKVGYDEQQPL